MKKAVQLYSIREKLAESIEEAFKVCKDIGYEGVEFASISINQDEKYIKSLLEKYDLTITSTHIMAVELFKDPKRAIEFYGYLGCKRLVIPYYEYNSIDDVYKLISDIKSVLPMLKEASMKLYYHNHDMEFKKFSGENVIEILAKHFSKDELSFEFDVYWVKMAKEDPVHYLEKYKDRIDIFHAKDGNRLSDTERKFKGSLLGEGEVDLEGVFNKAYEIGVEWVIVESEATDNKDEQIKSIKEDYKKLLNYLN